MSFYSRQQDQTIHRVVPLDLLFPWLPVLYVHHPHSGIPDTDKTEPHIHVCDSRPETAAEPFSQMYKDQNIRVFFQVKALTQAEQENSLNDNTSKSPIPFIHMLRVDCVGANY